MSNSILLMTRPLASAQRFVESLSAECMRNTRVIYAPLIQITPLGEQAELQAGDSVIFTSANAVAFAPAGESRLAHCVGQRTAEQAVNAGWDVAVIARDADDLVARIPPAEQTGPLVHLSGRFRRGDIAERLAGKGHTVRVQELYVQEVLPLSAEASEALSGEAIVIVPLFSPRTAAQFDQQVQPARHLRLLAMSPAVGSALGAAFAGNLQVASAPTASEMRRGVEKLLCGDSAP